MKLTTQKYESPLENQGSFDNVIIQDVAITHRRLDKFLSIRFEMSCIKNNKKVIICIKEMMFIGMEDDIVSSNQTTLMSIPNPDYDSQLEGSEERITVPMFGYLESNNGVMPSDFTIVDYGYPTYEKVMGYFNGGTLDNPEITITEPLAIGFILNKLIMNEEPVGNQFTITE
jgi:hypothetical protein